MIIRVECSWCKRYIGTKKGKPTTFTKLLVEKGLPIISHGMCQDCRDSLTAGIYADKTPERSGAKSLEN